MPKILITGCSSGFGLAIAQTFLSNGWEVVATMRTPRNDLLPSHDSLKVLALDVTDAESIANAVEAAGPIDALVNNAGVGMLSVLEGTEMSKIRELFETNVFGAMAMTNAVLPQMRDRRSGVIVNVSSSVTIKPLPALSVYSASKAALNAFTESLALEANLFGVRTKLVLPGSAPTTGFGKNAVARMGMNIPEPYAAFVQDYLATLRSGTEFTTPEDVAQAVWCVVTEPDAPMKTPAGADAQALFRDAGQSVVQKDSRS
ncbi:SDR family oxidoreductase [Rhizobium ruizarguesonis]|uniref:SDR family oxidoreductase n=1 Tax=Rhizobium ruizarguesonis TaxID=2081791 RepID=UPI0010300396|nr:SDR family oxidoreductase [Rhizobium ruizarguesonis]NEH75739.1 SDR family NAD(P)-dependent oxidoreductase [Rhizobium ruizarguesonis]NEJ16626.1 SDR family NAD(P)-dependent oxidoreductase [Rhizobium ruizarguesonis]NEJ85565.1 SDR family NAD(P)-dependent oxidoreductase [Rhizobium ruizarguesonis]NEK30554.1 SDR family NAD(P)-dependent oxidoreductase [Rhizobium ruizarguesonis]TAT73523.1 SDR family oxidoreductase [Rhizobium ruizarguesonis]